MLITVIISYFSIVIGELSAKRLAMQRAETFALALAPMVNAIAKLAVSKGLYYVDLWEVMADENGYLRADLAGSDGLHLLDGSKYRPWLDYLAAHTIYSAHNAQFALADGGAYR